MSNDHPNRIRILPWHTIQKIVGHTDYYSRFALREISKEFKKQVDRLNCRFEKIDFKMQEDEVSLAFTSNTNDTFVFIYKRRNVPRTLKHPGRVVIEGLSHVEMAVCRLATVFRNPKTTVNILDVYYTDYAKSPLFSLKRKYYFDRNDFLQTVQREMSSLGHRMHIEQLRLQIGMNELEGMRLLEFIKRATLRRLQLHVYPFGDRVDEWKRQRIWNEFMKITIDSVGKTIFEMHFDQSTIAQMNACLDRFSRFNPEHPFDRHTWLRRYEIYLHLHCRGYVVFARTHREPIFEQFWLEN